MPLYRGIFHHPLGRRLGLGCEGGPGMAKVTIRLLGTECFVSGPWLAWWAEEVSTTGDSDEVVSIAVRTPDAL